jgi:hypothetical protein
MAARRGVPKRHADSAGSGHRIAAPNDAVPTHASIDTARKRASEAGVADRIRFEVASAKDYPGTNYDLIAYFDCLHDMGDPEGPARYALSVIADDGTVLLVEPFAGNHIEDNLNPISQAFYGFSTVICTMASKAQEVGRALGAQTGEAQWREIFADAGFTRFRRATETPFNLILEARPYDTLSAPASL